MVGASGWRQHPGVKPPSPVRPQLRVGTRPRCTMKIYNIAAIFILIEYGNAKIHGGPRGRFDKHTQVKSNHHVSAHHAHYSYHPPREIYFMCRHCSNFATFPVYHGLPPTYVYRYREAGGRFSDLLTGLALYNLGRASTDHWQYTHYYKVRPEEKCSMQVIDHKHSEEVPVPCFLLSSFMERSPESLIPDPDALDITSPQIDIRPFIYHNGTTLKVTWEQECVLWRNVTLNREKNVVPCALLKTYSETMKPSGIPVYVWLPSTIAIVIAIYVACQCFFRRKIKKESQPFNQGVVIGYCTNQHY
ncbi:unnamed protein product [Danaus chrysippus]|uniref:(African queen) hypothetical protein n=1 Tax=Danaus chrysippus TaxID=151541 RepID=A0A8J2VXF3_9NEOP|nr:unnamed protein product [Danaus chrysippus]